MDHKRWGEPPSICAQTLLQQVLADIQCQRRTGTEALRHLSFSAHPGHSAHTFERDPAVARKQRILLLLSLRLWAMAPNNYDSYVQVILGVRLQLRDS